MESTFRTGNNNQTPSEEIWSDIDALIGTQQEMTAVQAGHVQATPQASFGQVPHNHLIHTVSLPAMTTTQPVQPTPTPLPTPTPKPALQAEKQSTSSSSRGKSVNNGTKSKRPYLRITEQPTSKGLRFRYVCEGRTAGSIPGANSTPDNKTYPTVEIVGYKGEVALVVSCVTKDKPHKPHPHKLVVSSKDGMGGTCKMGVFSVNLNQDPPRFVISNVGIQCTKKSDIRAALKEREERQTDPFKTGFSHMDQPSSIDLNVVRLCFQAFIKVEGKYQPLDPVVSDAIFERKAHNELTITRLCSCVSKMNGNSLIIMLCDKVTKEDIKIKLFETNNEGDVVWSDLAEFQQTDVHKQTAIAFRTPAYTGPNRSSNVTVQIQLYRPSDGATSEPRPFEYQTDPDDLKRKRIKVNDSMSTISRELQQFGQFPSLSPNNLMPPAANRSPNYTLDIKAEDNYRDIDSHSNTSASSCTNTYNTFVASPANYSMDSSMADAAIQPLPLQNLEHCFNFQTLSTSIADASLLPTQMNGGGSSSNLMQIPQAQSDQQNNNNIAIEVSKFEQCATQFQKLHQQQQQQPFQQNNVLGTSPVFHEDQAPNMTNPFYSIFGAQSLHQNDVINQTTQQQYNTQQHQYISNTQQQQQHLQTIHQPEFPTAPQITLDDVAVLDDWENNQHIQNLAFFDR